MTNYQAEAKLNFEYTQKMRRDFHQNPELSFEEFRTAEVVAREIKFAGFGQDRNWCC